MKKVNCIVIFTKKYVNNEAYYILNSITVKHKNNNITLCNNLDEVSKKHAYKYKKFDELYQTVLNFLKANNYYVSKWEEFNSLFYDIDFIDTNDYIVNRYPIKTNFIKK